MIFGSDASYLVAGDTNKAPDIFLKDLANGAVTRLSTTADGRQANGGSYAPVFAPDGRSVVFYSNASNLVAGDTNKAQDIFLKDLASGAVTRLSTTADGQQANGDSSGPVFAPDGRSVVFYSYASNLVAGDTNGAPDIFLKDLASGTVTRLSITADGYQANKASYNPVFAPDGRSVVFQSDASNLVAKDTNNARDIFLKDLASGTVTRLSTTADGQQANYGSYVPAFAPDGRSVVFQSDASNLVAGDTNGTTDVFIVPLPDPARFIPIVIDTFDYAGTNNADSLIASDGNDRLQGLEGNDTLPASLGRDSLEGGAGDDIVSGGEGSDYLAGGDGADSLDGGNDFDWLDGGAGNDALIGGWGHDRLNGGDGDDALYAEGLPGEPLPLFAGLNTLEGGAGNDTLLGGQAADRLDGGKGDDSLEGGEGNNWLAGGKGNDTLTGGSSDDTLLGGEGNDSLTAGEGSNRLDGGDGNDTLTAGTGADTLLGGEGADSLIAGEGNNSIDGGHGADSLTTGSGNDFLRGGAGADTLTSGSGRDVLVIGRGDTGIGERDLITDFDPSADRFDLRDLGTLTWNGPAAFTAGLQARYTVDFANNRSLVQINLDDNPATSELDIELTGFFPLNASHFIL
jgi:Ca2+-binding RTX toxin-like protein